MSQIYFKFISSSDNYLDQSEGRQEAFSCHLTVVVITVRQIFSCYSYSLDQSEAARRLSHLKVQSHEIFGPWFFS
jgi:hypothetical protein